MSTIKQIQDTNFAKFSDTFLKKYHNKQPNWGFNGLGYIIFKRTYARPLGKRTEEWNETVKRCVEGAQEIGSSYTREEAERLYDHIFNLRCSFAGRPLWQLGTDTVRKLGANSLINCLEFSTSILTRNGIKKIGELSGTTQTVMTEFGKWTEAEIKNFGEQKLFRLRLKYGGNIEKEIYTTIGHRWFREPHRNGKERISNKKIEVTTKELIVGDKLTNTFGQSIKSISEISRYGIIHGLMFGDGSVSNNVGHITLCGDKNKELLYLFQDEKKYTISNKDVIITNLPSYFKHKPDIQMDKSYLYGWLSGYFAADGCISENGQVTIASSRKENMEFIRDVCSVLGIFTHDIKVQYRIGIGQSEPSPLYSVTINGNFLDERFFLITKHRDRFVSQKYKIPKKWTVVSVEETDRIENVFCAIVPDTHSFVLDGGILTGNCFFTNVSKPSDFLFIFENLMLGGGIGFSVKKEHVYEFPKVKENVIIEHKNTKDADFIVPDSREGWIAVLDKIFDSFFNSGKSFSYSTLLLRGRGEPIKTFGGISSGPVVLVDGIKDICNVLKERSGKKVRSIDVLDICNIIGQTVCSGNVRRSAEMALGDVDDILFLRAKRWDTGKIPNWRAMSNNTVECDDIEDLQPMFWEGYKGNGEPYGLFNLKNSKKYGRIGEENYDASGEGLNPCLRGDTLILTKAGEVRIDSVVGKEVDIWNGFVWATVVPQITGYNQKMLSIKLDNGKFLDCTLYHEFIIDDDSENKIVKALDLKIGQYLSKYQLPNGTEEHPRIIGIEKTLNADKVYCFTEPIKHQGTFNGIVTRQCGEIVALADKETCNLGEVFMNNIKDIETFEDCVMLMYKYQKAVCNMKYIHQETQNIVHKNNRIRIGVTGILQNQTAMKENWYDVVYKKLKKFDKDWSKKMGWNESIRLTTVKPSGCQIGSTLIPTDDGIFRLDEIGDTDGAPWQEHSINIQQENTTEKSTKFYINGVSSTYIIRTSGGIELESTPNHKYRILRGEGYVWVESKDIVIGDALPYKLGGYNNNNVVELKEIDWPKSEVTGKTLHFHKFVQPKVLDEDFAWLLGLYFADGSNHKAGIRIAGNIHEQEDLYKARDILEKYNINSYIDTRGVGKNNADLYVNNTGFLWWLKQQGLLKQHSGDIKFPFKIRQSGSNIIKSFIDGFFCGDGSDKTRGRSFVTVSKQFAMELVIVGRAVGLDMKMREMPPTEKSWGTRMRYWISERMGRNAVRQSTAKTDIWNTLDKHGLNNFLFDRVVGIERSESETYDVEVPVKNTYIANSYVSHNTVSLLAGATPGVHPAYSRYYIRRVEMSSNDPLVEYCRGLGFKVEYRKLYDGTDDRLTVKIEFPCSVSGDTPISKDLSALQLLDYVKFIQKNWADNAVSVTCYYKLEELKGIRGWLEENYKNNIKTLSFLLHDGHGFVQAPYEPITKEKYNEIVSGVKPIIAVKDNTYSDELLNDPECLTGTCPIR